MSKCSIEAYLKGVNTGKISNQMSKIYSYIKRNPGHTVADILFHSTGMRESSVTARISDLLDQGFIKIVGVHITKDTKYSTFEVVTCQEEAERLSKDRKNQKKDKAINNLLKNHSSSLDNDTIMALELEQSISA